MLGSLAALIGSLVFEDLRMVAMPLAWLVGDALRVRRGHVETAMARAGVREARTAAAAMYASLAALVLELLWMAGRRRDLTPIVRLDADSRRALDAARSSGRGVVIAASHTGNWELAAAAIAREHPLSVLVKPVSLGVFDDFMRGLRAAYGVRLLEGPGALFEARQALARGGLVAVLHDQVPPYPDHAEWLPFLGEDALTDRAAAALAASTGAPLLVTAQRRDDDGHHHVHVLGAFEPPRDGEPREALAWARTTARAASDALAAFILRHPSDWLWMHRRWRAPVFAASREASGLLVPDANGERR